MKIGKLNRQNFGNQQHRSITSKYQVYLSFGRSTRTILRKGCAGNKMKSDSTKGLCSARQNHNFTPVLDDRQKFCTGNKIFRFYETVALGPPKSQFYPSFRQSTRRIFAQEAKLQFHHSFAGSTRTILRNGCIFASNFQSRAPIKTLQILCTVLIRCKTFKCKSNLS